MIGQSSLIWRKEGDFHFVQASPWPLIRCVEYTSVQAERAIQKLELFGYRTGYFTVRITAKDSETYRAIALIQRIHNVLHVDSRLSDYPIDCYSLNINDLKQFINALTPHYAELEVIKPEIFEYLDAAFLPLSNSVSSAVTKNSTPETIPSPSSGCTLNALADNSDPQAINLWFASTALAEVQAKIALAQASSVVMSSLAPLFSSLPFFSPLMASMAMRASLASLTIPTREIFQDYQRRNQGSEDNLQAVLDQSFAEAEARTNASPTYRATLVHRLRALLAQSVAEANASTTATATSDNPPATLVHNPEEFIDQSVAEANVSTTATATSDNPPAALVHNPEEFIDQRVAETHASTTSGCVFLSK